MKEFLPTVQKIVATSIFEVDGKVLLFRGTQVADDTYEIKESCYFDIPRFEVSFGESPEDVIRARFVEYFNQELLDVKVLDIQHYIVDDDSVQVFVVDDDSVQVFEIIYKISCEKMPKCEDALGKFLFANIGELDLYMLEHQLENIRPYLV